MTFNLWALALLVCGGTDSLTGTVKVVGPAQNRSVILRVGSVDVTLTGDLVDEVARLQAARLEVLGSRDAERFAVVSYRIMALGGRQEQPMLGYVVQLAMGIGFVGASEEHAEPIPLSLSPRSKEKLQGQVGAKIWVYGKKLLSGELQVQGYGVLRPAPQKTEGKP